MSDAIITHIHESFATSLGKCFSNSSTFIQSSTFVRNRNNKSISLLTWHRCDKTRKSRGEHRVPPHLVINNVSNSKAKILQQVGVNYFMMLLSKEYKVLLLCQEKYNTMTRQDGSIHNINHIMQANQWCKGASWYEKILTITHDFSRENAWTKRGLIAPIGALHPIHLQWGHLFQSIECMYIH